jgi:hypothetical protein
MVAEKREKQNKEKQHKKIGKGNQKKRYWEN